MITLDINNFGGGRVTLRDYQGANICILNGIITVDTTNAEYIAANRLELDLPVGFSMTRSAISTAILVSSISVFHMGTVLQCWIEQNKLCIEKLTAWDNLEKYEIYINSAFITRGFRGAFSQTKTKPLTILSNTNLFGFKQYCYIEIDAFVFFAASFNSFPEYNIHGKGPFNMELSGFASDVNLEIPLIVNGSYIYYGQKGSLITKGTFNNCNLSFSFPDGSSHIGGANSFFNFFAIR